jgi:AraC family transcriptional regulator, transcriptional activator of the genes for pyochelin and ferripyochelin receptors
MMITLLDRDWEDLWAEGRQTGTIAEYSDEVETIVQGSLPYLGNVWEWIMPLRDGLWLAAYEYHSTIDITQIGQNLDCPCSLLSFFVAGNVRTKLHGLTEQVDEAVGRSYLSCFQDTLETETWTAGKLLRVQICIDPHRFFGNLPETQLNQLPSELRQIVASDRVQTYYRSGVTTPEMQMVLHQILHCPYQGLMKRLYLEGKALELMTLQFNQFQNNNITAKSRSPLHSDDIERIYQAKEILIRQLDNPPSLLELARQVSMNDHKLKQGFRQVFNTTVFGYLHNYRLEQARQLLETSEMGVVAIARQVGFADRSYFAAAFRKKFGVNPGVYQRSRKRSSVTLR